MNLKGFAFPILRTPLGYFYSQEGNANLKADLLQLLLTNPGDRVMLPQYGTPLRKYIFEQNVDTTKEAIRNDIINAIETWEPRITVNEITVDTLTQYDQNTGVTTTDEKGILIKINYINPEEINNIQNLVLVVPFEGV